MLRHLLYHITDENCCSFRIGFKNERCIFFYYFWIHFTSDPLIFFENQLKTESNQKTAVLWLSQFRIFYIWFWFSFPNSKSSKYWTKSERIFLVRQITFITWHSFKFHLSVLQPLTNVLPAFFINIEWPWPAVLQILMFYN